MDIPKNEATFTIEHEGETTGQKYEGKFTVRTALNMLQKHNLELEKTRLLADYSNPTDGLAGIALILSNLRVKIVDAPEWWKQSNGGLDVMDEDVLVLLYRKIVEKELEWREAVKNKGKVDPEATPDPNALKGSQ